MKLSRFKNRLIKNFLAGLAIGVGILTSALLAVTVSGTFNTFSSGALLKSSDINANFATLKAAIESIPNWTISGSSAVYSGGNVIVNTTSAANSANLTVSGKISSANLGLYCGITASSFTGNIGGFTSAKALCATACGNSNAHMCTAHEIIMSLQLGVSLPGSGNYWITSPTTSANTDLLDCNSWTSSSASPNQGSIISIGSPSQLFIAYCNTSHQIACCL
jgi:hypothetical protein